MTIQSGSLLQYRTQHQALGLAEIVDFLCRSWKIIAGTMIVMLMLTLAAIYLMTPRYSATSELLLETPRENVLGTDGLISGTILNSSEVESQLAVLKSRSLLQRVAVKENLAKDPEFGGVKDAAWFASFFSYFRSFWSAATGEAIDEVTQAGNALSDAVEVSRSGLSNVIEITVSSSEPKKAAALANAVAKAYLVDQLEARFEGARRASNWLNERQKALQAEVSSSEAAVEDFKIKHNLLATRSGSITEQQLSELNSALIQARAETAAKRSSFEQVQKLLASGGDVQAIPDILRSGLVSELRARLTALAPTEADLRTRYGERHPDLIKIRTEQRELQDQIKAELDRAIGNLKNDLEAAESREASLAQSLASVSNQSGMDNQVAVQLRELERIAAANKQIYESFLSRARIAEEETKLPTTEARIISQAAIPETPDFPPKKLFAALSVILGIGIGTGVAILLELLRPGFMAQRQVQELLDLPVLASLPRISAWEDKSERPPSQLLEHFVRKPSPRYIEAVRSLRFGINTTSAASQNRSRVVQITSTMPEEGKTTLAVSLARSSAAAGELVLLIDGDLRLGGASRVFNRKNALGLVDVLTSSADPIDAIHYDEQSGIHILPAGARTLNPPALLDSNRMQKLIGYAKNTFDKIIIDSPPVAIAADAAIMSYFADTIVFAVKWSDTPREAVSQAILQLRNTDRLAGIVLTMVDERKLPRYGRYLSLNSKVVEKYGYDGTGYLAFNSGATSQVLGGKPSYGGST